MVQHGGEALLHGLKTQLFFLLALELCHKLPKFSESRLFICKMTQVIVFPPPNFVVKITRDKIGKVFSTGPGIQQMLNKYLLLLSTY